MLWDGLTFICYCHFSFWSIIILNTILILLLRSTPNKARIVVTLTFSSCSRVFAALTSSMQMNCLVLHALCFMEISYVSIRFYIYSEGRNNSTPSLINTILLLLDHDNSFSHISLKFVMNLTWDLVTIFYLKGDKYRNTRKKGSWLGKAWRKGGGGTGVGWVVVLGGCWSQSTITREQFHSYLSPV